MMLCVQEGWSANLLHVSLQAVSLMQKEVVDLSMRHRLHKALVKQNVLSKIFQDIKAADRGFVSSAWLDWCRAMYEFKVSLAACAMPSSARKHSIAACACVADMQSHVCRNGISVSWLHGGVMNAAPKHHCPCVPKESKRKSV